MARRRLFVGLLAPASLVILVVALGALQYRWVGQVSEAERLQMTRSLDRRSHEFADEFDREIGRAYQMFTPPAGITPQSPESFPHQFDTWLVEARFPGLVKSAYLAVQPEPRGEPALYRYVPATRTFEPAEWPASFQKVRARLQQMLTRVSSGGDMKDTPPNVMFAAFPVMPDVPALVIGEVSHLTADRSKADVLRLTPGSSSFTMELRSPRTHVVLEIDRDYLANTVLPALAERHFPDTSPDRFRISVLDSGARVVTTRGLTAEQSLDRMKADATAEFFGIGIRFDNLRAVRAARQDGTTTPSAVMWSTSRLPSGATGAAEERARAGASAVVVAKPKIESSNRMSMVIEQHTATIGSVAHLSATPWTLLLQHSAGSLDAAVDRARLRNLWLSFGILGVLATSAGLVMVNARRSERLAAQQMDFVATVSHELRTPVAVIRSAAQNLAAGVVHEPDQARRYGDLIEAEGRRLTDMVEQVLEYAGLSDTKRARTSRPMDAGRLVEDVVSATEALPEASQMAFEVRVDAGLPPVMADEDAIRRALLNLVGNALKYAADGGWIGLSAARGSGRDDKHVLISVADKGRGIPAEDLAHIFEPFYRGAMAHDRQIHGNGLGLSLVKRIVEAHGGRVAVKSAPGQGSTFTLYLPVASEVAVGTPAGSAAPALTDPVPPFQGRS
jgi:two-component system sensor histidine kinase SenX3